MDDWGYDTWLNPDYNGLFPWLWVAPCEGKKVAWGPHKLSAGNAQTEDLEAMKENVLEQKQLSSGYGLRSVNVLSRKHGNQKKRGRKGRTSMLFNGKEVGAAKKRVAASDAASSVSMLFNGKEVGAASKKRVASADAVQASADAVQASAPAMLFNGKAVGAAQKRASSSQAASSKSASMLFNGKAVEAPKKKVTTSSDATKSKSASMLFNGRAIGAAKKSVASRSASMLFNGKSVGAANKKASSNAAQKSSSVRRLSDETDQRAIVAAHQAQASQSNVRQQRILSAHPRKLEGIAKMFAPVEMAESAAIARSQKAAAARNQQNVNKLSIEINQDQSTRLGSFSQNLQQSAGHTNQANYRRL